MRTTILLLLLLSLLSLSAPLATAQVTVEATAGTDLTTSARAGQVEARDDVPAGTPLGTRFRLEANAFDPFTGIGSNAATFTTIDTTPERIEITHEDSARGGFSWLGQGSAGFGAHTLRFVFRSPRTAPAVLRLECCGSAMPNSAAQVEGVARVAGDAVLRVVQDPLLCFGGYSQSAERPVVVGPGDLVVELETSGYGIGSLRGGTGTSTGRWRLTLRLDPDFPCEVTEYGTACGLTLAASGDLRYPGMQRITLTDTSRQTAAFLGIGLQRVDVPLLGCRILTDAILIEPFAIREGVASTLFLPDGLPSGLRLTAQGATLGAEFRTSNGLELIYR